MPSPQGPLLPRRSLGAELRRLRGNRTLDDVATDTAISTPTLSRLENGHGDSRQGDIRDLINLYRAVVLSGPPKTEAYASRPTRARPRPTLGLAVRSTTPTFATCRPGWSMRPQPTKENE
jgi:transcriptional regulator with XRE-family HTH domain